MSSFFKFATNYERVLTLTTCFVGGLFGAGGLYLMNETSNAHAKAAEAQLDSAVAQHKVAESLDKLATAQEVNKFTFFL